MHGERGEAFSLSLFPVNYRKYLLTNWVYVFLRSHPGENLFQGDWILVRGVGSPSPFSEVNM